MGIPIRRQQIRQPDAATVALLAVGLLLALAAGPAAYWAVGNWRTGSTPPVVTLSPLPNPLETPKASPSPAPTPTPVSVVAGLQGKIAISSGQPGSGGWIRFPGGNFVADPKSNVTLPGGGWAYGLAWNAATNSWVPVNWYMVRQDGQIYAFQTWSNTSATVEVVRRTGTSYLLGTLPAGSYAYSVLSAEPEGVHVA